MVAIARFGPLRHLRAEPNQHVIHYRRGRAVRQGRGLAFWFNALSAAVAQLPGEDCETTFLLNERSVDLQEVTVQVTLRYRIANAERAAERFNFAVSLRTGVWLERPLETLANFWSRRSQDPARSYLAGVALTEAIQSGAVPIRGAIETAIRDDEEIAAMGLELVDARVVRVAPTAELERALQTPTREALQQKADEAIFRRRAEAVEKERSIKENELATEIELERRQEELIARQGSNRLLEVRHEAEAARTRTEAEIERTNLTAEAEARQARVRADGEATATRMIDEAKAHGEKMRVDVWKKASGRVLLGLALQDFARKIEQIQHLNLSPSLFGQAFEQLLLGEAAK